MNLTKERLEEIVQFLVFERDLFSDSFKSMIDESCEDKEEHAKYLLNFTDTIDVVISVLNNSN